MEAPKDIFIDVATKIRRRLVNKTANEYLDCYCAIASFRIWRKLKQLGYTPIFVVYNGTEESIGSLGEFESHCFVICDGYLIDVTATQFRISEKVIVRPHKKELYWLVTHSAKTHKEIKELLKTWPSDQKPSEFYKKVLTNLEANC